MPKLQIEWCRCPKYVGEGSIAYWTGGYDSGDDTTCPMCNGEGRIAETTKRVKEDKHGKV